MSHNIPEPIHTRMAAQLWRLYLSPFSRRCRGGCSYDGPHNAHLTALGRKRYTGSWSRR